MNIEMIIDLIKNANVVLPALEVVLLLAFLTICLVFKMTRMGLIAAYLFVYKWGWSILSGQSQTAITYYLVFGTIVGILTIIGMIRNPDITDG